MNMRAFQVKKVPGGYVAVLREYRKVKREDRPTVTKWTVKRSERFIGERKEARPAAVECGRNWCRGEK